jgi:hypothetical protein
LYVGFTFLDLRKFYIKRKSSRRRKYHALMILATILTFSTLYSLLNSYLSAIIYLVLFIGVGYISQKLIENLKNSNKDKSAETILAITVSMALYASIFLSINYFVPVSTLVYNDVDLLTHHFITLNDLGYEEETVRTVEFKKNSFFTDEYLEYNEYLNNKNIKVLYIVAKNETFAKLIFDTKKREYSDRFNIEPLGNIEPENYDVDEFFRHGKWNSYILDGNQIIILYGEFDIESDEFIETIKKKY